MGEMKTASQLVVECLVRHGVKYIFGIPGAKIDLLFDSLLDSPIKVIVCRHEQNAAFMASAYGRITGEPGVVVVTSGPGVSNLATGLLTATTEGDPVIALGGSVPRSTKLRETHQNVDNLRLMQAVTKLGMEVIMAENVPEIVENAFRIANKPRSGAVFISLPQDVLQEKTDMAPHEPIPSLELGKAPDSLLERAARMINDAKKPLLFLGLEASRLKNALAIRKLLGQAPLATIGTYQAAGALSREREDCFIGRVGLFRNQPGDALLDAADVVITVGYDPIEYDPEVWNAARAKKIIHIDYYGASIHTAYLPQIELAGDIAGNLSALAPLLVRRKSLHDIPFINDLQRKLDEKFESGAHRSGTLVHPLRFIHDLRKTLDDEVTVISDIGSHYIWIARYFRSYAPRHLLFSNGQQTLGVGLPWAMGTCLARPGKKVISISGDGGFLFSAMELETAVREKMSFVHFVWCDGSYDMVMEQQMMKYGRESAVRFGHVDIVKFAESFGAHGFRINHSDEFKDVLTRALEMTGPVIVEVPIDYSDNPELFKATDQNIGH
ncbi:MAG: acetolactate synthase AlsS [Candidatus Eremiobacteraeota bacterium]|nr:acetolactate synthase AlsS [Candidatus Eremiobacteraeota bacterium]